MGYIPFVCVLALSLGFSASGAQLSVAWLLRGAELPVLNAYVGDTLVFSFGGGVDVVEIPSAAAYPLSCSAAQGLNLGSTGAGFLKCAGGLGRKGEWLNGGEGWWGSRASRSVRATTSLTDMLPFQMQVPSRSPSPPPVPTLTPPAATTCAQPASCHRLWL